MSAPETNGRPHREAVTFPANTPVTLALAYPEPRMVSSPRGERAMYSTADNRVVFVDPAVAGRIAELGINVRESFTITRKPAGQRIPDVWEIARVSGEQPNGTLVVPSVPKAEASSAGSVNNRNIPSAAKRPTSGPNNNVTLVDEANAVVDAYAAVLERALNTYQGRVKPDEIRSILLSAYIQRRSTAA